nr:ubiquitin carboxyl-terminal hydrolase miy1 [Quercus suber]
MPWIYNRVRQFMWLRGRARRAIASSTVQRQAERPGTTIIVDHLHYITSPFVISTAPALHLSWKHRCALDIEPTSSIQRSQRTQLDAHYEICHDLGASLTSLGIGRNPTWRMPKRPPAEMVTRKPVPAQVGPAIPAIDTSSAPNPPYPTTPTLDRHGTASTGSVYSPQLGDSPAFDLIDLHEARKRSGSNSDISSHGTWNSDDNDDDDDDDDDNEGHGQAKANDSDIPKPLRITPTKQAGAQKDGRVDELPAILRVGPANGVPKQPIQAAQQYAGEAQSNPWMGAVGSSGSASTGQQQPIASMVSNNPYRQQNGYEPQNSQSAWQEVKLQPPSQPPPVPPVELPTVSTPAHELSHMSLNDATTQRPAEYETAEVLPVPALGQPPMAPVSNHEQSNQTLPASNPWQEEQPWYGELPAEPHAPVPPGPSTDISQSSPNPIYAPPPGSPPVTLHSATDHPEPARAQNAVGAQSARPGNISIPNSAATRSTESIPETPGTRMRRQKNEHYQIKNVRWLDGPAMRTSPVLTQNANGPCPLLALVNALVLSTPPNLDTALIETLRTREQVSLGLLLDAVFDELMSGRRGDTAYDLPDVSDLYAFLLALHTGMNVNPRFVTTFSTPRGSFDGHAPGLDQVHPLERAQNKPGCFEETREMRLYSTFNVPLIHGWTAPRGTPAYDAFERSAQTFEDAQNIQFAEPELEDKLRTDGLSPQEQQTLEDIHTIKSFLNSWPTQLTDHGLGTIASSLKLGQIAILFRNDHFSTLYKESKHGALMALVTDSGYSSHDEIVWESLVDVNGAASEMFSGDFRTVSHHQDARLHQNSSAGGEEGWQTVPSSRSRTDQRNNSSPPGPSVTTTTTEIPPPLPGPRPGQITAQSSAAGPDDAQRRAAEQEDHDLALALQLQEEEEDHQRQAEERRRREQQLSEQFLSTEAPEGSRPVIPPRRGNNRTPTTTNVPISGRRPNGRPAVNRPADADDPEAPPSYEQAATDRPYRPAGSTAPGMQGSPLTAYDALRRQQNAMSSTSINTNTTAPNHNRRRSEGNRIRRRDSQLGSPAMAAPQQQRINGAANVQDADERCSVM